MTSEHIGSILTLKAVPILCGVGSFLLTLIGNIAFLSQMGRNLASPQMFNIFGRFMLEILCTNFFTSSHVVLLFDDFCPFKIVFFPEKVPC